MDLSKSWDRVAALVLPRMTGWQVWAETAVITLAAVLLGLFLSPGDPLYIRAAFPWTWFAPVLLALRYGVLAGVVSTLMIFVVWAASTPGWPAVEVPKLYFLGGLLLAMICGEYSGIWRTRLRRQSELVHYLQDRVERITKRLYLLRLSHDRLEQDLLSRPVTLRDALSVLRQRIAGMIDSEEMPGAQAFIEFLAQYCQLEAAALYTLTQRDGVTALGPRVARLGEPPALEEDDPLYTYACAEGRLAHILITETDTARPPPHLVVAPLVASDNRMSGVLVVSEMPFFALNEDTLQMMQVLLSAYADGIASAHTVLPLLAAYPGCPPNFAAELLILQRLQRDYNIDSHITVMIFGDDDHRPDMFQQILRQRRGPDVIWSVENLLGRSYIVNLMPLAGKAAVEGYLVRTEMSLKQTFGGTFAEMNVRPVAIPLSDPQPLETIKRLMLKGPA
jgi:hypothetical protein